MFRTLVSVENISAFAKSLSAQSVPYQSRKILFRSFPRLGLYVRSKKSLKVSSTMFSFLLFVRSYSYVLVSLLRDPILLLEFAHPRIKGTGAARAVPVHDMNHIARNVHRALLAGDTRNRGGLDRLCGLREPVLQARDFLHRSADGLRESKDLSPQFPDLLLLADLLDFRRSRMERGHEG